MPILYFSGKLQKTTATDQGFIALQGVCLFSLNFVCFYYATSYISSGLVSIIFSFATVYNAINSRIFYKEAITSTVVMASILGVTGLAIVFYPELQRTQFNRDSLHGIGLALLGTLFFSFANMISKRHSNNGIKPQTAIAYGMIYGSVLLAGMIVVTKQPITVSLDIRYISSLLYLSTIGTIVAFIIYLTLVARIGPTQAAYTTVLFPIVALGLSSLFEDFHWSLMSFLGLALVMVGNILINAYPAKTAMQKRWLRDGQLPWVATVMLER